MSYLDLAKQAIIEPPTPTEPSSRAEIKAALTRLKLGETSAIRLYSTTCKGEFLILKDDVIPDSITVNCPVFTLAELNELIGSDSAYIRKVYQLKEAFAAKIVSTKPTAERG